MLHDNGFVVWHNVPKLRNIVVIDPQWFADAMASVVTFICQSISKQAGLTNWEKMKGPMKLKYFFSSFTIATSNNHIVLCFYTRNI